MVPGHSIVFELEIAMQPFTAPWPHNALAEQIEMSAQLEMSVIFHQCRRVLYQQFLQASIARLHSSVVAAYLYLNDGFTCSRTSSTLVSIKMISYTYEKRTAPYPSCLLKVDFPGRMVLSYILATIHI